MLAKYHHIKCLTLLLLLVVSGVGVAQIDSSSIKKENHNKALFAITKYNIKRYSMTIHPHHIGLENLVAGSRFYFGTGLEYEVRRGSAADLLIRGYHGGTLVENEGDSLLSVARLTQLGVNLETRYGYHHIMYGALMSYFSKNLGGLKATAHLGYKFQNPTRRFVFKLGVFVIPNRSIETIWAYGGIALAFGKAK